jgi:serine/threonine protein kinase/formylglycine-generating enzyme required for sulfatase activity
MSTDPSTPENDSNLSGLGRALLESKEGSKPSGPWVPPTAEELGKLLPEYDIVKMLGRGGMGAVYMGRQKSLDRPVAIKILSNTLDEADASFAERFKNEARAMGKLNHPGIVAVHDFGQTSGGLLYIVMEYVEGTDVARMIAKEGRLHTEHAMAITAHVCDALQYAHDRGIIHRDIKPANIMVGYDGVVKVADFGLAKMTHSQNTGLTQSGMAMGTLHYMAPEALMLGSSVDHRADIYAVGVMLYQMLTGKIPQGMFKLPSLQIPGLDPRYDAIIAKGIMEDREARYQSVGEMRLDLDGILTQPVAKVEAEVSQAPAALPTQARPQRPGAVSRQPYRPPPSMTHPAAKSSSGWLTGVVLGLLALGCGYVWFNRSSVKPRTLEHVAETLPKSSPTSTASPTPTTAPVTSPPPTTAPVASTVFPPKKAVVPRKPWPTGPNYRVEGRFRAWSSQPNDPALDLAKLQGVDDVAQVYVDSKGWLVLRQNGDLLSNISGIPGQKDIRRICRGEADDLALITRAGGVIPFPQRTDPTNRIPDGLGPVKDVYISGFHQAAILEDGSLVAWGTAHDGVGHNKEWKDKPVLPLGRKAVAMSNTVATMGLRTDDGKILRWGLNGGFSRSQGKFDADPETPFLMNGMALYAVPKTDGPILIANWRGNDPATPFADDIRGRDFIPSNSGGKHIVLLDRDGRLVLDPMCPDRSITAALDFVTLAERDLVSVHFSDKNQPATRFLWFDKASPDSPASSPGTSPTASGPLLAIPDFRTRVANYQKARHTQLAELTTKYRAAVKAEKDAATNSGVLANVTAADAATANAAAFAQLIEANLTATEVQPLPALATVPDPAPPRLKELRDIFVREVTKIETALVAGLDQSLATVQATLVKATQVEHAKALEAYREEISAALKTPPALAASDVGGYIDLFSPAEQTAWKQSGKGGLRFESGIGTTWFPNESGQFGVAWYAKRKFSDFALQAEFRAAQAEFISGLRIRFPDPGNDPRIVGQNGYEISIIDPSVPLADNIPGVITKVTASTSSLLKPQGEWNNLEVSVTGQSYTVTLNSQVVTRFTGSRLLEGYIGIENHMRGSVQFRNMSIKDLRASTSTPTAPASNSAMPSAASTTPIPTTTLLQATKDKPFVNSRGMKFVPVPGTQVLFCIHETRKGDYAAYAATNPSTNGEWQNVTSKGGIVSPSTDHPVVNVNRSDAQNFCAWLSQKDGQKYRLPTDREWSFAVGIGERESATETPASLNHQLKNVYPWGTVWPPPKNSANLPDTALRAMSPQESIIQTYTDGYATTAPVMSFNPNKLGLYDLAGNVWEWCEDRYDPSTDGLARGSTWFHTREGQFAKLSSHRQVGLPGIRNPGGGFRVVLELP